MNAVAKEVKDKAIQDVKRSRDIAIYISTMALTLAPVIASSFIAPVSISVPTAELSDQQTPLSQANVNSTVNLSSAHYVPTPQVVLENKANEYEQTLNNALKSAEKSFGIPQNSSGPQWFKDLHKSETTEEIIDGGALSNLFHGGSNSDYQFAKPNIPHAENSKTVDTAVAIYSDANTSGTCPANFETSLAKYSKTVDTAITKHNAAENAFMSTWGSFLRNLNPFGFRGHHVNTVKDCNYQSDKLNIGPLYSVELSKFTEGIPSQSQCVIAY